MVQSVLSDLSARICVECAVNVSRFADPVSQEEMEVAAQGVVPDNTKRNNEWAANNFAQWAKARGQRSP